MNDPQRDLARANLYRYLSVAPLPPDDPRFELLGDASFRRVAVAALAWIRDDPVFHPSELGPGELHPSRLEPESLFPDEDGLQTRYVEVFGHSISKDCPPYENEYQSNKDISFRSQQLADIAGFYQAFQLDRAASARERLDHLSFEAEFSQIVIARQLYATHEGLDDALVDTCRRTQRRFFAEHLGWWLPAFGVNLESHTNSPFYSALGRFVRGFVAAERAVLGLPPFTGLPATHSDTAESEADCLGCALGADNAGAAPEARFSPPTPLS